jgi:tripeptidyl-peptidase-1
VGATQGPEQGNPEIACQSQKSGVITTGGGFSTYYPAPSWQQDSIFNYLDQYQANPGFNPNGRAYPDVSMIGVWYQVVIQGVINPIFGTSASAPVFAAMVSLVNAARASEGKGPVGFLNPTLYNASSTAYFNDITSGINNCTYFSEISDPRAAPCCDSGFSCVPGWDPVTGHGSINYINLKNMFDGAPPVLSGSSPGPVLSAAAVVGIVLGVFAGSVLTAGLLYYRLYLRGRMGSNNGALSAQETTKYSPAL